MGLFDRFFKRDTIVKVDSATIMEELVKMGFNEDQASKVAETITTNLADKITEKRELSEQEFIDTLTESLEGSLYYVSPIRTKLCYDLKKFADQTPEVKNSVKIYASYVVFGASEVNLDDYKVILSGRDNEKVRQAENEIREWERQTKIRRLVWHVTMDTIQYGDGFLEKVTVDGVPVRFNYLPSETIEMKLNPDGTPAKYYQIIDPNLQYLESLETPVISRYLTDRKIIEFEPHEIVHFNDGSPAGIHDNPIKSLVVVWRFLRLFEQALLIHRVTRARRFIIFFLDVTGKKKIKEVVRNFTNTIKNIFRMSIDEGELHSRHATIKTGADLVIPITKDSATNVKTIPSDPSATKLDDLKFYVNRILTNMLTSHIFGAEKTGKEQFVEKAFFRIVRIYQRWISYALEDLYNEVLQAKGYSDIHATIQFPNPDPNAEIRVVETIVRRMMIINQMVAALGIAPPTNWVVDYVFKDLSQSEVEKLVKMLEYEMRKQQQAMQGEELPSLFSEGEAPGAIQSTESPFDILFTSQPEQQGPAEAEISGETAPSEETTLPQETAAETQDLANLKIFDTEKVQEQRTGLMLKATELALEYLKSKNGS